MAPILGESIHICMHACIHAYIWIRYVHGDCDICSGIVYLNFPQTSNKATGAMLALSNEASVPARSYLVAVNKNGVVSNIEQAFKRDYDLIGQSAVIY